MIVTYKGELSDEGSIGEAATEALAIPSELIQTDGSTSLLLTGNVYYVDVNGSGQPLKFGGAPVTVGEFGSIAPIGRADRQRF